MKVIFLDVDGVLNMHTSGGMYALNKKRLRLLNKLVKETGAFVVLSSTWRKHDTSFKKISRVLSYRGIKMIGVTPDRAFLSTGERGYRGHEIKEWLDHHPQVEQYVILDDDGDMLDTQLRNFVQTDGRIGLTETLIYRAKYILENGPTHIK